MIKKFTDESKNTYIFIESGDKIILCLNGNCEYSFLNIITMPRTLDEALKIIGMDVWYPIEEEKK